MRALLASALFVTSLLFAAPAASQAGPEAAPWRVLKGELTREQFEKYTEVPFDLPEGVKRITIRFSYSGKEQKSVIDLALRDPQRFRGASGGTRVRMTLSTEDATPGYLPGPLPAGRWALILGAPNIRPGAHAPYEAQIFLERAARVTEFAEAPIAAGPGWYRGDLHLHSGDSDGKCKAQSGATIPCPVYRTVEAAAARGLDFMALSDHNTTAHYNAMREAQGAFDRMLLVPAREITTFWGHANVFGPTDFLDFRMTAPNWDQARTWIDAAHRAGGVVSVNHPGLPSGEACMGCGWSVPGLPEGAIDAVEVLNGSTMRGAPADGGLQGFAYWHDQLAAGRHVTGLGGSDSHDPDRPASEPGAVGSPTTVIHMPELSVRGMLAGIRSGRVFIDVDGTKDRFLDLSATAGGRHAVMGETLPVRRGEAVHLAIDMKGVARGTAELTIDGMVDPRYRFEIGTTQAASLASLGDGRGHWIRADIRDASGRLVLIGNPIYITPMAGAQEP